MARTGNTFWPDDTHDTLHLTKGYDFYDPGDYADFIMIKADANCFERMATKDTASNSDDEPLVHGHFSCCPIM